MTSLRLTFITPLFSRGSYEDQPEIRPPSIRGQLHWWFRALGGSHTDEKAIFGSVHTKPIHASKIVVRVGNIQGKTGTKATLPHKAGGQASEKAAFLPGTAFDLHLTERLRGLTDSHRRALRRTLEAWLLAGTLGLRATRAGGSFTWQPLSGDPIPMPATQEAYAQRLAEVFQNTPLKVSLLKKAFTTTEEARKCISDTLGGRDDRDGQSDLSRLRDPLGKVFGGRKTSPLRFRIVQLGQAHHIVATWDNRTAVTGNQPSDLDAITQLLQRRGKAIGTHLADPFP